MSDYETAAIAAGPLAVIRPSSPLHPRLSLSLCPVDLISIDRRNRDLEAECLERAATLSLQFHEKVRDTKDHMWKPAGGEAAPAQSEE